MGRGSPERLKLFFNKIAKSTCQLCSLCYTFFLDDYFRLCFVRCMLYPKSGRSFGLWKGRLDGMYNQFLLSPWQARVPQVVFSVVKGSASWESNLAEGSDSLCVFSAFRHNCNGRSKGCLMFCAVFAICALHSNFRSREWLRWPIALGKYIVIRWHSLLKNYRTIFTKFGMKHL